MNLQAEKLTRLSALNLKYNDRAARPFYFLFRSFLKEKLKKFVWSISLEFLFIWNFVRITLSFTAMSRNIAYTLEKKMKKLNQH